MILTYVHFKYKVIPFWTDLRPTETENPSWKTNGLMAWVTSLSADCLWIYGDWYIRHFYLGQCLWLICNTPLARFPIFPLSEWSSCEATKCFLPSPRRPIFQPSRSNWIVTQIALIFILFFIRTTRVQCRRDVNCDAKCQCKQRRILHWMGILERSAACGKLGCLWCAITAAEN